MPNLVARKSKGPAISCAQRGISCTESRGAVPFFDWERTIGVAIRQVMKGRKKHVPIESAAAPLSLVHVSTESCPQNVSAPITMLTAMLIKNGTTV